MEAYLDNSATTRCSEAAKNKMVEALTVDFGNPSSMHMKGVEAEKYVKEAATAIAKTLRCQEKEIVFTSGGTESNNLAIIGTALANQRAGRHIITTSVEHASVKNTMRFLEEEGFEILPQYFMWMRSRHMESSRSFRNGCISICFLSADTRFMDRKALDFYILKKKQKFVRFLLVAISRKVCVPERLMYRE